MTSPAHDDWIPCPEGTLTSLRQHALRARRQQAVVPYLGGAALGAVVFAILFGWAFTSGVKLPSEHATGAPLGGLACTEVVDLMQDHRDGELPEELSRRVAQHLRECPGCAARYQKEYLTSYGGVPLSLIIWTGYAGSPSSW